MCGRDWRKRAALYINLTILLVGFWSLTGCRGETPPAPPKPTDTEILPTNTPRPTPTPREMQAPTATETQEPTQTGIATSEPLTIPDFSNVSLYWKTFLGDPHYFQVTLEGWPEDVPEDVIVRVGTIFYNCDQLYPNQYPTRVYCWGNAPPEGANVVLQVIVESVAEPLVEIPFTVPYIPRDTQTPEN